MSQGNSGSIGAFVFRGVDVAKVCLGKKLRMRMASVCHVVDMMVSWSMAKAPLFMNCLGWILRGYGDMK